MPMTLWMLFYRLVSESLIPNKRSPYQHLSRLTARGRRARTFPSLIDPTRPIHEPFAFESPEEARDWLRRIYRLDRTEGQSHHLIIGVEKATQVGFLTDWFEDLPVVALRGFSSQTLVDEVAALAQRDERPSILIYAGDYDPSGVDIARTSCAVAAGRSRMCDRSHSTGIRWSGSSCRRNSASRTTRARRRSRRERGTCRSSLRRSGRRTCAASTRGPWTDSGTRRRTRRCLSASRPSGTNCERRGHDAVPGQGHGHRRGRGRCGGRDAGAGGVGDALPGGGWPSVNRDPFIPEDRLPTVVNGPTERRREVVRIEITEAGVVDLQQARQRRRETNG